MVSQFIDMESDNFHGRLPSNKIPETGFHQQTVKTVAYLRVSTAQQDAGSQRLAILEYARKHDDVCRKNVTGQGIGSFMP